MSAKHIAFGVAFLVMSWLSAGMAVGQSLEFQVKKSHIIGGSRGTLVFGEQGIQYQTTDKKDARTWSYENIKQVQVLSATRIAVRTYEDQGWTKLWRDRTYEFQIEKGAVTPALASFLLAKVPRPVVTAVLPTPTATPRFRVPVKHVRGRHGSNGELLLYADALVYQSPDPAASRYWRFGDLASVLTLDRYRLDVEAHEGGAGDTRTFLFQLKTDLPPGFYDALWSALNAPPMRNNNAKGGQ